MIIYTMNIDGITQDTGFTSLRGVCEHYKVSYNSAARGKRQWFKENVLSVITPVQVQKISGRGRKK
jgi:hypothetical protein